MAKQVIINGTVAGDGTGENLFLAFGKVNANFTELYNAADNKGTFTPVLVAIANADAASAVLCHYEYTAVNRIHVWGAMTVDPTAAANTVTTIAIPLPVASNFTSANDAYGVCTSNSAQRGGIIYSDAATDRAYLTFASEGTDPITMAFNFDYEVK